MFVAKNFEPVKNTVAFYPAGLEKIDTLAKAAYLPRIKYRMPALWFSPSPSTLGSLVLGTFVYTCYLIDGQTEEDVDYNYEGILRYARDNQNLTEVSFSSHVVLSDDKLWSSGGENILYEVEEAIVHWRNLPNLNDDWDGWYKLSNRR